MVQRFLKTLERIKNDLEIFSWNIVEATYWTFAKGLWKYDGAFHSLHQLFHGKSAVMKQQLYKLLKKIELHFLCAHSEVRERKQGKKGRA